MGAWRPAYWYSLMECVELVLKDRYEDTTCHMADMEREVNIPKA